MEKIVTYFGIVEKSEDCFGIFFPDLPGCVSMGNTFAEVMENAKEALALHLWGMEEDGDCIPAPTMPPYAEAEEGDIIVAVSVYPDLFRHEMDDRAIRTNVCIPAWMKKAAEAAHLNYSQLLQTAIIERLQIEKRI